MIPWWGSRIISSSFTTGHATISYQLPKAMAQQRDISDDDQITDGDWGSP